MSQKRFFEMLKQVPRIKHLWSEEKKEIILDVFEKELSVMSPGEVYMAKFFASVWFGDNRRYGFDLVDAVASIDMPERKLIIDWIANPFWP